MLIRHVKIEIPTVNCHSDLLCQTTNRSFKIQGSSVAIQSRSSHLKILFHFIALPDAFLHNNLTQAPKNYSHTFWRVAPKIISILFGGGRNLKNKKNLEKPGKTHKKKKKKTYFQTLWKGGVWTRVPEYCLFSKGGRPYFLFSGGGGPVCVFFF